MTVDVGQTLKLDVEVEGCPEPKVKWFKDGKEITLDARIKIERDTHRSDICSADICQKIGYIISYLYKNVGNKVYGYSYDTKYKANKKTYNEDRTKRS